MKKCFIFGALETTKLPITPEKGDLVIAADRGYERALALGITPDLLVADFDSMPDIPRFEHIIRLNTRKDDTDVAYAVNLAFEKGYTQFVICGGAGGKLDHSLANIQLCSDILRRGGSAVFCGEEESFTVINTTFRFDKGREGRFSVFSLSEKSEGVSIRGASYEAREITLSRYVPLGVSNAFVGEAAEISVRDGELLIIWQTA